MESCQSSDGKLIEQLGEAVQSQAATGTANRQAEVPLPANSSAASPEPQALPTQVCTALWYSYVRICLSLTTTNTWWPVLCKLCTGCDRKQCVSCSHECMRHTLTAPQSVLV